MGRVIIEVFPPHGPPEPRRHVLEESPLRVGRAYDNDLILTDRFVSPHHLLIRPADGADADAAWEVFDLDSENGFAHRGEIVRGGTARLESGDEVVVGKTRLRFLSPHHPVPGTRRLAIPGPVASRLRRPVWAWCVVLVAALVAAGQGYLDSWSAEPGAELAEDALGALMLLLFWAGGWGFLGRVLTHRWHFHAQVAIGALFISALLLSQELGPVLSFPIASPRFDFVTQTVLTVLVFGTAFYASMRLAAVTTARLRGVVTTLVSLALAALLVYAAWEDPDDTLRPRYSHTLAPVPEPLLPTRSIDEFLADRDPFE